MIRSFKHKGLQLFYETGNTSGIQAVHSQKLKMRLVALDTATCIEDMNLPRFRLHSLRGDKQGIWAIDVNKNWRLTFKFENGHVYVLNYEDYH